MDLETLEKNGGSLPRFETERLIGREWTEADVEAAFAIYGDPEIQAGLAGTPEPSLESQRANLLKAIEAYRARPKGTGFWALERKSDGAVVGATVVKPLPNGDGKVEIGWQTARAHWGQGFATEGARAGLSLAFERLPIDRMYCLVKEWNTRSQRVAEKLGFRRVGPTTEYYDMELILFDLERGQAFGKQ